jgi:hypothetical protein
MNTNQKAYTVGRGKLYVGIFAPNTETVVGGEMYFGNTPSIAIAATYNDLPHYSSDDQNQFQDDNFTLRTDRNLTFTCDNMSMQTWGLMLGDASGGDGGKRNADRCRARAFLPAWHG